jgi:hypothetical protein
VRKCVRVLQVFIDTNVYLTFYSLASEDLEELRKLHAAVENGALRLFVPDQVRDEIERNRETRFLESLEHVRVMRPKGGLPQMARDLPDSRTFQATLKEFGEQLNELEGQLVQLFDSRELGADKVLEELLDTAESVPADDKIREAARERVEVGSPPGKKGSLGDAINWESLLVAAEDGDLDIVTGDGDYTSGLSKDRVKPYLAKEWEAHKGGEVRLYRRISDFLKEHFPDIKVATELEKEIRIQALVDSASFDATHRALSRLRQYTEYTPQQAADLLEAALTNSQIRWIAGDSDVRSFFEALYEEHADVLDEAEAARFERYFFDDK